MKLAARLLAIATFALPALASAATPQVGVEQQLRRGFFVETDLGTYFDVGGGTVSNAQAYMQLGIGYDITERFTLSLQFGLGASSGVCLAQVANDGTCGITDGQGNITTFPDAQGVPQKEVLPDNFSNTFYQLNLSYRQPLAERLGVVLGVVAGYQNLDPAPLFTNNDPNAAPISGGIMFGGDISLEYATNMDHFFVGIDAVPRFVIGPNLLSVAIFPRVKYTF